MTTKTHLSVGLASITPILTITNLDLLSIVLIGSIFPDIDKKINLKHRGLTHSLIAMFALTYGLIIRNAEIGTFFLISYGSHILIDMLTIQGVKLLYPFCRKQIGLKLIRTEGKFDKCLSYIAIIVFCIKLLYIFKDIFNLGI